MKMVIVMRTDLNMRKGKMCAQAAHAAVTSVISLMRKVDDNLIQWLDTGQKKIVVGVGSEKELYDIRTKAALAGNITFHTVVDAGHTEFHDTPTITCIALGPDTDENLDPITGDLKLL